MAKHMNKTEPHDELADASAETNLDAPAPPHSASDSEKVLTGYVMPDESEPGASEDGKRARTTFTTKLLLPERKILYAACLDKPKGTVLMLGRLFGTVTFADIKSGALPDGTPSQMPRLQGVFEFMNYITGEVGRAGTVYLPRAFSQPFVAHFMAAEGVDKIAEIDVDIGVESTAKVAIPYEWVVIAHIEGEESQRMKTLRMRRGNPAKLRAAAIGALQLTGPKSS